MENDIGKIKKNSETEVVVRIDDYKGKKGVTIREFVTSAKYTGFTKSGTRIPADKFLEFRELINTIKLEDLKDAEKAG
ncbi:MAG: PC4/YdbC family ssDNA-binding protein [Candidatus Pacearchaeota archaeon]|nr:PC4/YdbC family ssDNA-binding protein [Candidatus Pacearchaeota archaeon]